MNKALVLAAMLSASASVAFAGGPVVIAVDDEVEVTTVTPRSGALLPLIVGALIIGAVASGGGSGT